jgi:hypothetical protein
MHTPTMLTAVCFLLATGALLGFCIWVARRLDDFRP